MALNHEHIGKLKYSNADQEPIEVIDEFPHKRKRIGRIAAIGDISTSKMTRMPDTDLKDLGMRTRVGGHSRDSMIVAWPLLKSMVQYRTSRCGLLCSCRGMNRGC